MKILPLRNQVVCKLLELAPSNGHIVRVRDTQAIREAEVLAVGPECRDVQVGQVVIVNRLVLTQIGEQYLTAESHILGTR